jgi:transcription termination factor NusB
VQGTLERRELIEETIDRFLKEDINLQRTDKILKIIIFAAVYELMFKHKNSIKVIIGEYLKASEFFLESVQIKYLNAILDKLSSNIRNENH